MEDTHCVGVHLGPRDAEIPSSSLFEAQSLVGEKDRGDHNTAGGIREGGPMWWGRH